MTDPDAGHYPSKPKPVEPWLLERLKKLPFADPTSGPHPPKLAADDPDPNDPALQQLLAQVRASDPTADDIALSFIKDRRGTLVHLFDTFWRYKNGHWRELPLDVLQGELALFIGRTRHPDQVTPRRLRTIPNVLQARLAANPNDWNYDPDLLPCSNGLLHLADRRLDGLSPDKYLARTCAAMYDEHAHVATCPAWDAFIASTFPPAEAQFLQEFAGLSLTFDTSHETAVWLHGPPGSGKSTFVRGMEIILGERAAALNLDSLSRGRLSPAWFFGRTLLISVEQPIADLKHDHLINALVSGEPIPVRGSSTATARSSAKWLWALTSLPRVGYAGSGLFRRARIVTLPPRPLADRDPSLKAQFADEATGILRWALAGLDRLRHRGRIALPASVLAADERYQQSNDLIAQFLAEQTLPHPNDHIQSSDLYSAYAQWCAASGHSARSTVAMASELQRLGYERRRTVAGTLWYGLSLISSSAPDAGPESKRNAIEPVIGVIPVRPPASTKKKPKKSP
jgi:putative DNA primase/helicase